MRRARRPWLGRGLSNSCFLSPLGFEPGGDGVAEAGDLEEGAPPWWLLVVVSVVQGMWAWVRAAET